jgi:hypothetical protein
MTTTIQYVSNKNRDGELHTFAVTPSRPLRK